MKKKLGIIDSGIGGLSLLNGLLSKGMNVEYHYCSDNDNVPYGEKSQDFMLIRVTKMVEALSYRNVDAILLACNTLTAETIDQLRKTYKTPFIGIEPYINFPNHVENKNINCCLILTEATKNSERFKTLQKTKDPQGKVKVVALKNLALLIEAIRVNHNYDISAIHSEIELLKDKNFTHCILGCTHYPFIKDYLEQTLKLKVVDPTQNVINEVSRVLNLDYGIITDQLFYYSDNCGDHWQLKSQNFIQDFYFKHELIQDNH